MFTSTRTEADLLGHLLLYHGVFDQLHVGGMVPQESFDEALWRYNRQYHTRPQPSSYHFECAFIKHLRSRPKHRL